MARQLCSRAPFVLLRRLAPATMGQLREMARGRVAVKAAWPGWPNKAKDGWTFARYMKGRINARRGEVYETKQQKMRRLGLQKGHLGRSLFDEIREQPMYEVTSPR